jgi:TPR repeat protein
MKIYLAFLLLVILSNLSYADDFAETLKLAVGSEFDETMEKAKQGSSVSQYIIATQYQYGFGEVEEDDVEAVKWMRKAALQGEVIAEYNLGLMLANGEGVPKNYLKAMEWLNKAARQGYVKGQFTLGKIYAEGEITPIDYKQAIYWLSKVAKQGDTYAMSELAWSFKFVGNRVKAYSWWSIAVSEGYTFVTKWLDEMESIMTLEQIAQAQELAAKCFESDYKDCN